MALSKPLDDPEGINFDDLFSLKDIQEIQDLFAEATGVIRYPSIEQYLNRAGRRVSSR